MSAGRSALPCVTVGSGNVRAETENSESLRLLSGLPEREGDLCTPEKDFLWDFSYFQLFQVQVHKPSSVLRWKELKYTGLPRQKEYMYYDGFTPAHSGIVPGE